MSQILPGKSVLWRLLSSSAAAGQQTLDSSIIISDVVKAEIIWTLSIVDCYFSLRSSDNKSDLFSTMLPDSAIA